MSEVSLTNETLRRFRLIRGCKTTTIIIINLIIHATGLAEDAEVLLNATLRYANAVLTAKINECCHLKLVKRSQSLASAGGLFHRPHNILPELKIVRLLPQTYPRKYKSPQKPLKTSQLVQEIWKPKWTSIKMS